MSVKRPYTLTIAGFDPSAGAGVLADVKTFTKLKTQGLAVTTAITYQNEDTYIGTKWLSIEEIIAQISPLQRYDITYAKIGLIQNFDVLGQIVDYLHEHFAGVQIIWDPIMKASAGTDFHTSIPKDLDRLLEKLYLITPNLDEIKQLTNETDAHVGANNLAKYCNVLLKGGHSESNKGKDYLYTSQKSFAYNPKKKNLMPKHGSGCVFSAALCAQLTRGYKLHKAILKAKDYTEHFLGSNTGLLGYHV